MALYSDKVMEHFMHPRNVGEIANPDGIGEVGNPVCGDMMTFMIKVENNRIVDLKFKTFGCGAAIAVSSIVSEMAMGKTLEEALKITNAMVAKKLGGLPKNKLHCSNLGADALHAAIKDYMKKHSIESPLDMEIGEEESEAPRIDDGGTEPSDINIDSKNELHLCPYCDEPLEGSTPLLCNHCHMTFIKCPECGELVNDNADTCPHCGADLSTN